MTEQWKELKETIIELRDNGGTGTQQEVCNFLANYMDILEKQMQIEREGNSKKEKSKNTGIKLDGAIERSTSNAEFERTHGNLQGCLEFRQLAKWLRELKMYRCYLLMKEGD